LDRDNLDKLTLKKISGLFSNKAIGLIQLRDKVSDKADLLNYAFKLKKSLGSSSKALFIINDYLDLAIASQADGVHLGQGDLSLSKARKLLGKDKIIGVSCHSLAQALKAQKGGADYIGIGPIYSTATKPEYKAIGLEVLRKLKGKIKIPYYAIGGIDKTKIARIVEAGATRIAVCRAILKADNPDRAANQLFTEIKNNYFKFK